MCFHCERGWAIESSFYRWPTIARGLCGARSGDGVDDSVRRDLANALVVPDGGTLRVPLADEYASTGIDQDGGWLHE